jgi:hypothetical protein
MTSALFIFVTAASERVTLLEVSGPLRQRERAEAGAG